MNPADSFNKIWAEFCRISPSHDNEAERRLAYLFFLKGAHAGLDAVEAAQDRRSDLSKLGVC